MVRREKLVGVCDEREEDLPRPLCGGDGAFVLALNTGSFERNPDFDTVAGDLGTGAGIWVIVLDVSIRAAITGMVCR